MQLFLVVLDQELAGQLFDFTVITGVHIPKVHVDAAGGEVSAGAQPGKNRRGHGCRRGGGTPFSGGGVPINNNKQKLS